MNAAPTWDRIKTLARQLGFDRVGVAPPALPAETEHLDQWIDAGYAGDMEWLPRGRDVRLDLRRRFPWARSVVVVSRGYRRSRRPGPGLASYVSTYAWGADYHDVLLPDLRALGRRLAEETEEPLQWHAYVDTGPALERQLAQAAGLGWLGKNTLMMNAHDGSESFLGVLITDLDLEPTPARAGSCGTCRACQPACPTDAFVAPGVLDARRCVSYLTIEHRGPIDRALRPGVGAWLFGCDLCQTACPFNHDRSPAPDWLGSSEALELDLTELLTLDEAQFRERFRRTPLWRPRREGLLRNALIVAGNLRRADCAPAARRLLRDDSATLREAASWSLVRCGDREDRGALEAAAQRETEPWVREAMAEDLAAMAK